MDIDLPGSGNIYTNPISAESDYECFQKCKKHSECEMFTWISPNFEGSQLFLWILYLSTNMLPVFFFLFVDPELHNTCLLKKDVYDRIDKEGVTSGFITDECKGKKIRFYRRIHDRELFLFF